MTKSFRALLLPCAAALAACGPDAPTAASPDPLPASTASSASVASARSEAIPGHYIVMLRPAAASSDARPSASAPSSIRDPAARAASLVAALHGEITQRYAHAIDGFAAQLSDSAVAALRADPAVLSVEHDQTVVDDGTETNAPWGLDRIDQAALPLSTTYGFANAGAGVSIYVLDHGISFSNFDFGGRAVTGFDAVTPGGNASDCTGHGTEVASIAGGSQFGVAKSATLVAVRVTPCSGQPASMSQILQGIDWVTAQKKANPTKPSVANMSFHAGISAAADTAVARMVAAGVVTAVSAGNGGGDACTVWPAHLKQVITVGGSDKTDTFWSTSNRGPCLDIVAPAVSVPAAINTNSATTLFTGTSAATPHAAGAAALYLAAHPTATPAQVEAALIANASVGRLKAVPANTANRLLNTSFITAAPTNQPPNAWITAPASTSSFAQGASVAFAGGGLDSEDGSLTGAKLVWRSSLSGTLGTGASVSTSALAVGRHTITLSATDSKGATGNAIISVTITASTTNHAPTATISAPASGAAFAQGASVTFSGSGSDAEDGALTGTSLVWKSSINGQIGTGTSFSTAGLSAGTHTITLTANDSKGAAGTASRTITITSTNKPPVATISTPANGASFAQGTQVTFSGSASDPEDGALTGASLIWKSSINGQFGTGASVSTSTLSAGTQTITLTAKDSKGATAVATRTVTITPSGGTTTTASFTVSCTGLNPHQCAFDASASKSGATITSYAWNWGNGRAETKTVPTTKNTWAATGTYTVTLTVTDTAGHTASVAKAVAVP